ncbi:MAG TPA: choice-of-anchor Q domain-containing protein [Rhodanobacteraceae bacterium]|nr:choice-of-anchor Q domain-containing protein [Rhodanobacteraceae bacterium]
MIRARASTLVLLLAALLAAASAQAATLTVTGTADPGSGQCTAAACTLRDAISSAQFGDVIVFADSLGYPATITLDGNQLLLDKDITILGAGADKLTIDANQASRIFMVANGATVTISGLKLVDGRIVGAAGPSFAGAPGDRAYGGAVAIDSASALQILRCVLIRNEVAGGAGSDGPGPGDGGAAFGGAIENAGTLMIGSSSLVDNHASGGPGGTDEVAGTAGGIGGAASGGAIHSAGPMLVVNTQFLRNSASGALGGAQVMEIGGDGGDARGGAIASEDFVVLSQVTMMDNTAAAGAGQPGDLGSSAAGTAVANDIAATGTLLTRDSVFASSGDAGSCDVATTSAQGINFAADSSCGGDLQVADPRLQIIDAVPAPIAFPHWGSPLIDAAASCNDAFGETLADDARGVARPLDADADGVAGCDIGAVESDELFAGGFD